MLLFSALRRRSACMASVLALTLGLAMVVPALAAPAARAAGPSEACTQATIKVDRAQLVALLACAVAGAQEAANPIADLGCYAGAIGYLNAVKQRNAACSASTAQNLSDNISADPGTAAEELAAAGDTNPQPGDVVDLTVASYDGQDSSGNYDYTLDITGWEDQATWDGGGSADTGCAALCDAVP